MKYRLKIPEMIPKEHSILATVLSNEDGKIIDESAIKNCNPLRDAPSEWLVEIKEESAYKKWANSQRIASNKESWNAAIDAAENMLRPPCEGNYIMEVAVCEKLKGLKEP